VSTNIYIQRVRLACSSWPKRLGSLIPPVPPEDQGTDPAFEMQFFFYPVQNFIYEYDL